jgi:hypothetical protein
VCGLVEDLEIGSRFKGSLKKGRGGYEGMKLNYDDKVLWAMARGCMCDIPVIHIVIGFMIDSQCIQNLQLQST